MLTAALAVAVVGIALLAAAVLTDNTILAVLVIAIAVFGVVLLARDWLADRRHNDSQSEVPTEPDDAEGSVAAYEEPSETHLEPDEFEPDVPYGETEASDEDATSS